MEWFRAERSRSGAPQKRLLIIFVAAIAAQIALPYYATLYVSPDGSHTAPYATWAQAATNLEAVAGLVSDGTTVWVSNGTYRLREPIVLASAATLRSVNGAGVTIVYGDRSVTSNRCFFLAHPDAVLDGFTISNGYARHWPGGGGVCVSNGMVKNCTLSGNGAAYYGGGAFCFSGGVVSNCVLRDNTATLRGAGAYCYRGGFLADCSLRSNTAGQTGGAVYCDAGGRLVSCEISGNTATLQGGGVFCSTSGTLDGCMIVSNRATNMDGGGVYCNFGGIVTNCSILGNVAGAGHGGGVYFCNGGVAQGCRISGNAAGFDGGGVRLDAGGMVDRCVVSSNTAANGAGVHCYFGGTMRSSVLWTNAASGRGGGAFCTQGGTVQNCTVSGNTAAYDGGGLYCNGGGAVENTIAYFNAANSGANIATDGSGWNFINCCTTPALGAGSVTNDPLFANAATGELRLQNNSPCLDQGTNQLWMIGSLDLDGGWRVFDADGNGSWVADIGAFEFAKDDMYLMPVAVFQVESQTAPDVYVHFDAGASFHQSPRHGIVRYEWDFHLAYAGFSNPDPASIPNYFYVEAQGKTVSHKYGQFGDYYPVLRVVDDQGRAAYSFGQRVGVWLGNRAPVPHAGGPYTLAFGQPLMLDGRQSGDPDCIYGDFVSQWQWDLNNDGDFNDASGDQPNLSWDALCSLSPALAVARSAASGLPNNTMRLLVADRFGLSATNTVLLTILPLDSDQDGLPDEYELAHGLNSELAADAALDSDADGASNLQEFLAGTDPQNVASVFKILASQMSATQFQFGFATVSGSCYSVEWCDDLAVGNWRVLLESIVGNGNTVTVQDTGMVSQRIRFYRVLVMP